MLDLRIAVQRPSQVHMEIVWLFRIVALDFCAMPPFDPQHFSGHNKHGESCQAGSILQPLSVAGHDSWISVAEPGGVLQHVFRNDLVADAATTFLELETVAVVTFARGATVAEMIQGVCFDSGARVNLLG